MALSSCLTWLATVARRGGTCTWILHTPDTLLPWFRNPYTPIMVEPSVWRMHFAQGLYDQGAVGQRVPPAEGATMVVNNVQGMEGTPRQEPKPEPAVSRSWAEVQREAPIFQTETTVAAEQAVQEAALQIEAAPKVCDPIFLRLCKSPISHLLHDCAVLHGQQCGYPPSELSKLSQ